MEGITWRGNRETKLCHETHDFRKETMMDDICRVERQMFRRKYVLFIQRRIKILQFKSKQILKNRE